VEAQVIDGLTGVWTAGPPPLPAGAIGPQGTQVGAHPADGSHPARKLGAIGIHINRGITTHGLAINVNNDLQPFEWVVPCGIEACRMTSLSRELGAEQDLDAFATTLSERFAEIYERRLIETPASELAERVEGTGALTAGMPASVR
jgi:lipoate-protein ligase B